MNSAGRRAAGVIHHAKIIGEYNCVVASPRPEESFGGRIGTRAHSTIEQHLQRQRGLWRYRSSGKSRVPVPMVLSPRDRPPSRHIERPSPDCVGNPAFFKLIPLAHELPAPGFGFVNNFRNLAVHGLWCQSTTDFVQARESLAALYIAPDQTVGVRISPGVAGGTVCFPSKRRLLGRDNCRDSQPLFGGTRHRTDTPRTRLLIFPVRMLRGRRVVK